MYFGARVYGCNKQNDANICSKPTSFLSLSLSLFGVLSIVSVASCIFQDMNGYGKEHLMFWNWFFPLFHHAKQNSPLEEKSRDNLSISSLKLSTNSTLTIGQGVSQTLIAQNDKRSLPSLCLMHSVNWTLPHDLNQDADCHPRCLVHLV